MPKAEKPTATLQDLFPDHVVVPLSDIPRLIEQLPKRPKKDSSENWAAIDSLYSSSVIFLQDEDGNYLVDNGLLTPPRYQPNSKRNGRL